MGRYLFLFLLAVGLIGVTGCGSGSATPQSVSSSQATTTTGRAAVSEEQARVRAEAILLGSVAHYQHLLAAGVKALGSQRYATAAQGLAAFNDPNSAASRFKAYQQKMKPTTDISYSRAVQRVDTEFASLQEPPAVNWWQADMDKVGSALSGWVSVAVDWQIGAATTARLVAAQRKVEAALTRARKDARAVLTSSTKVKLAKSRHPSGDHGRAYNNVSPAFDSTTDLGYGSARQIWQYEWSACGVSMVSLAQDPDIRLGVATLNKWLAVSKQYAATKLAQFIETGSGGAGYTGESLRAAIDGCRNGVLWAAYHPSGK